MLITNFRLKYALYKLVLAGFQLLDTGRLHPLRERSIRALNRTNRMADAIGFDTQKEVLNHALAETAVPGHYLEFGVFTGGTIRYIAKQLSNLGKRDVIVHGFDSFHGLPEAWAGFNLARSALSAGGKLPRVPRNVCLHKGRFSNTIASWREQISGPVAFVHIDCDLYSSTVDVLEGLRERLQPGTIIVFDEYFNYPNWERHEFRAWQEFVSRFGTLDNVCAAAREAELDFEIIVVDDGSKDGSSGLVRIYIDKHPDERIVLRVNRINKGLAQNYVDVAFLGVGKHYRLVCGDNAEPRETIAAVLKSIGKADIIVPYYTSTKGRGLRRELISKIYTALINLITGNRIFYYNELAVHLRHNVMRWHPNTRGFGFQAEILCMLLDLGFSFYQVPVAMVEQRRGQSNAFTFRNIVSVAHTIFEIFIRRISHHVHSSKPPMGND